jgi:hypothetical protein
MVNIMKGYFKILQHGSSGLHSVSRVYEKATSLWVIPTSRFLRIYMFRAPEVKKSDLWNGSCLSWCMCVCMYVHLAGTRTVGRTLIMFGIQEFNRYRSVPGEYEYSSSKNMVPSERSPKIKLRFCRKRL